MKKLIVSILLIASCGIYANAAEKALPECNARACLSEDYYMNTGTTVAIYTESGAFKGNYAVYLRNGNRYIQFYPNIYISIQGKRRFFYKGNWYVIK